MNFQKLLLADRVRMSTSLDETLRETADSEEINAIAEFAIAHPDHWGAPWYGTPVALVQANFYKGEKFLGDLGVGSNFLTAQGCGWFYSRKVSAKDREIIMNLFGVEDPYEK